MVIDLTSSPTRKDLEYGSDNDFKKEVEDGFLCSVSSIAHTGCFIDI